MSKALLVALGASIAGVASAVPLTPDIIGHDFNFGAFNQDGTAEWSMNGAAADTLRYTSFNADHEVTAYWPVWPNPPVFPVFGWGGGFGGDFDLGVEFTAQDAPYVGGGGTIDVSLVGKGNLAGPDLQIFGTIGVPGAPVLLWALELEMVSLYGFAGEKAYVLEGVGTIVGGMVAEEYNLIGMPGGMRGHLDFEHGWMPALYDPLDPNYQNRMRAAYSGETGVVPEPATLGALALGLMALVSRRRR